MEREDRRDFSTPRPLMSLLDLVVTPETAVAHLAGAWARSAGSPSATPVTGDGWSTANKPPGIPVRGSSGKPPWATGATCSNAWLAFFGSEVAQYLAFHNAKEVK